PDGESPGENGATMTESVSLSSFPLPPLVKIVGPIGFPQSLLPGQDRVNWWAHTSQAEFLPVPPGVVDSMMEAEGPDVWNPLPGEDDPAVSVERVRQALNAAAERMDGPP
ncbi:MAG: hypothetical protein ACRDTT_03205, partial [Pseudonocardiaceae bacterium]